jgi:hypothetical protein
LGFASYGLERDLIAKPTWWLAVLGALTLMVVLWAKALKFATELPRPWRVGFWTFTLALAGICLLQLDSQWTFGEGPSGQINRQFALMGLVLPVCVGLFLWLRKRRCADASGEQQLRAQSAVADAVLGALVLGLSLAGVYRVGSEWIVARALQETDAAWAKIGRPMPVFKRRFVKVAENDSLRELTQELAPFGIRTLYKPRNAWQDTNSLSKLLPPMGLGYLLQAYSQSRADLPSPPAWIDPKIAEPVAKTQDFMRAHREDFDRLYEGILRREPPVWGYNPADSFLIRTPNFLALRELGQLIKLDAYQKLAAGDRAGAARALAAAQRAFQNLGQQPILVSYMIHTALDALLADIAARLPGEPLDREQLAARVESERDRLRDTIQAEYCGVLAWTSHPEFNAPAFIQHGSDPSGFSPVYPFRIWLTNLFGSLYFNWSAARDYRLAAQEIGVTQQAAKLSATDLGCREFNQICASNKLNSIFLPNLERAWLRVNFCLLLREQCELIRLGRKQMEAPGSSAFPISWPSTVIPGSQWEIARETSQQPSLTMKLTPVPPWVSQKAVIDDQFFLVPLDGSAGWKLGL